MIYLPLLRHQWRQFVRTFVWRRHWLTTLLISLLVLYTAFSLVSLGFLWTEMVRMVRWEANPVAFLNRHLVTIFIGLFALRFFVQRTPRLQMRPYLHLPLSRRRLVRHFQLTSLATIHNLFPFLFFVPLWLRHIWPRPYEPTAKWGWLLGVLIILLLSHYLNTLFRALLGRNREAFFIAFGVGMSLLAVDLFIGPGFVNRVSAFIFDELIAARPVVLALLGMLVGIVYLSSSLMLREDLRSEERDSRHKRLVLWQVPFRAPAERLLNLILLELKLIWRCERPKLYFLVSVVFVLTYVAIPLTQIERLTSIIVQALTVMFASGIFAFNYGQLMFSWESSYFDGVLVRSFTLREMVMAKFIILHGSCVGFFLLTLPLFLLLAKHLVPMHVAFLCYNLGISTSLIMMLALNNQRRVTLTRVGFFDFEGFSLLHWLWYIPLAAPPALLLYVMGDEPMIAMMIIGTAGLLTYVLTPQLATFFARHLTTQRYAMAAGFRRQA